MVWCSIGSPPPSLSLVEPSDIPSIVIEDVKIDHAAVERQSKEEARSGSSPYVNHSEEAAPRFRQQFLRALCDRVASTPRDRPFRDEVLTQASVQDAHQEIGIFGSEVGGHRCETVESL